MSLFRNRLWALITSLLLVLGLLAGAPYEQKLQVSLPAHGAASSSGAALAYLWARRRIGELMDRFSTETEETPAIKKEFLTDRRKISSDNKLR